MVALVLSFAACKKEGEKAEGDKAESAKKASEGDGADKAMAAKAEEGLKQLEKFADDICACKDMACAQKVQTAMGEWAQKFGDEYKGGANDKEMAERAKPVTKKLTDCTAKLAAASAPAAAAEPAKDGPEGPEPDPAKKEAPAPEKK